MQPFVLKYVFSFRGERTWFHWLQFHCSTAKFMGKLQSSGGRKGRVILLSLCCLFSSCDRNRGWCKHVRVCLFNHHQSILHKTYIFRDLKDPGEAIPKGTFAAIATTLSSYIFYVIITGSVAVPFVPMATIPDNETEFSTEIFDNLPDMTPLNCTVDGKNLHNCTWGLVGEEYQKVKNERIK